MLLTSSEEPASSQGNALIVRENQPLPIPSGPAEWLYADENGKQQGPLTREQLVELWQNSRISSTSLVWKEGMVNWQSVEDALGLVPRQRADRKAASSRNVGVALQTFALDPVGGLPAACEALGGGGSLALGIAFQLLFDLCLLLGLAIGVADFTGGANLGDLVREFSKLDSTTKLGIVAKLVFLAILPIVCLSSAISIVRLVTRGEGTWGFDVLIAGTALVPTGLSIPLIFLAGPKNWEVVAFLYLFCFCVTVLILNSGFTRIVRLPDRGAMLAIPAALLLTLWLSKVLLTSVLEAPGHPILTSNKSTVQKFDASFSAIKNATP
jgi:hypothetical protein